MTSLTIHMGEPGIDPAAKYIAPTGSDTTGAGTEASPWRTIGKFLTVAAAGDTLYCRGGTYTGSDIGPWTCTLAGTAGDPVTIAAYPGETPIFTGNGTNYCLNFNGASYITVDGLHLTGWDQTNTGAITSTGSAHHLTFRNLYIELATAGISDQHCIYFGPGVNNSTVEWCELNGNSSSGCGISIYSAAALYPHTLTIQRNIIRNFSTTNNAHGRGVNIDSSASVSDFDVIHNTFVNNRIHVFSQQGDSITIRDNAGTTALEANLARTTATTPNYSETYNFWGQTFDASYYLVAGQTGRSAASDGSDAGALDW